MVFKLEGEKLAPAGIRFASARQTALKGGWLEGAVVASPFACITAVHSASVSQPTKTHTLF